MNDKDKEAFEKWWENDCYEYDSDQLITQKDALYIWEKTCEYKQKEIDELLKINLTLFDALNCADGYIYPEQHKRASKLIHNALCEYEKWRDK